MMVLGTVINDEDRRLNVIVSEIERFIVTPLDPGDLFDTRFRIDPVKDFFVQTIGIGTEDKMPFLFPEILDGVPFPI